MCYSHSHTFVLLKLNSSLCDSFSLSSMSPTSRQEPNVLTASKLQEPDYTLYNPCTAAPEWNSTYAWLKWNKSSGNTNPQSAGQLAWIPAASGIEQGGTDSGGCIPSSIPGLRLRKQVRWCRRARSNQRADVIIMSSISPGITHDDYLDSNFSFEFTHH